MAIAAASKSATRSGDCAPIPVVHRSGSARRKQPYIHAQLKAAIVRMRELVD